MFCYLTKGFQNFSAAMFSLLFFLSLGYASATHAALNQKPLAESLKNTQVAYFHVYERYPRWYRPAPYRGYYRGPNYYRGPYWNNAQPYYYQKGVRCQKSCFIDTWTGAIIRCEKRCFY